MSRVMIYSLCLRVLIASILTLFGVDKTVTEDETGIVVFIWLPYTLSPFTLSPVNLSRSLCPLVILSSFTLSPVTLFPGHFVPWSLCPRSLCPLVICPLVTLSPVILSPVTLSPIFDFWNDMICRSIYLKAISERLRLV
jgi:hypothetical protein